MLKTNNTDERPWVVHVATYPPRECGIATFSADLIHYSDELFSERVAHRVVAMQTPPLENANYSSRVLFEIPDNDPDAFVRAAERLNEMPQVMIVSIQHEFGIFGDNYGENILLFLEKLAKPVVVTFHTVLPEPDEKMREVTQKIIVRANRVIVMTELSRTVLENVYEATPEKIRVIPHGIHPQLYTNGDAAKAALGLSGKRVLMTFGLLGRGKGIEHAIQALPSIVANYPNTVYLIVGVTHPVVLKREGEAYRNELIDLATRLGVIEHVIFRNTYLETHELLLHLSATDIYLSLSQNPNQAVSGTLSYALGSGRAVVSTAFAQAKELITEEVGALISFNDHEGIVKEVSTLLGDPARLTSIGKAAYFRTRNMTWENVALLYMNVFSSLLPTFMEPRKNMLPIKIEYLKKLTDDFGVLQFAHLSEPDAAWGYTLDDNARALVVICWYWALEHTDEAVSLAERYLTFIERASQETGGFVNYFTTERQPDQTLNTKNLEDANARALWALAVTEASGLPENLRLRARTLFDRQFSLHQKVGSPRAAAFYIKAFAARTPVHPEDPEILDRIRQYADFLVDLFQRSSEDEWQWFEESLTYSNGVLPEAMLIAHTLTGDTVYLEIGKKALDFLLEHSFEEDVCVPVGQGGWYRKGGQKERYDQQPEEVSALVLALHKMLSISDERIYREKLALAFSWFLGNNLLQQVVYTHFTGGCYDGIGKHGINLNQGSESTIAYLLARLILGSSTIPDGQ